MTGVGTYDARHRHHVVISSNEILNPAESHPIDHLLMESSCAHLRPGYSTETLISNASYPPQTKAYGVEEQDPALVDAPVPVPIPKTYTKSIQRSETASHFRVDPNTRPLPQWHELSSLPIRATLGIKEYCSYWLRHGECDYAQQGCLYKHEMPLDRKTLQRLGLRDIPKWYRDKHGLGSYLACGEFEDKMMREGLMERNWRQGRDASDSAGVQKGNLGNNDKKRGNITVNGRGQFCLPPSPSTTSVSPFQIHRAARNSGMTSSKTSTPKPAARSASLARRTPSTQKQPTQERQILDTIAELDAYEERKRDRAELLARKYKVLVPEVRHTSRSVHAPSVEEREVSKLTAPMELMRSSSGSATAPSERSVNVGDDVDGDYKAPSSIKDRDTIASSANHYCRGNFGF